MLATIPVEYAHRWYVLDAIADAVETFIKRTPGARAAEIQREADAAIRSLAEPSGGRQQARGQQRMNLCE